VAKMIFCEFLRCI